MKFDKYFQAYEPIISQYPDKTNLFESAFIMITNLSCHHSEITNKLGLEPNHAVNKGESELHVNGCWMYPSELRNDFAEFETFYEETHLKNLIEIILTKKLRFKELSKKYSIDIICFGVFYEDFREPLISISKSLLDECENVGITIKQFNIGPHNF